MLGPSLNCSKISVLEGLNLEFFKLIVTILQGVVFVKSLLKLIDTL